MSKCQICGKELDWGNICVKCVIKTEQEKQSNNKKQAPTT